MITRAAGILIISTKGNALFLKRGAGGDCPGEWCTPGGRLENGEDAIDAAIRETYEEAGFKASKKKMTKWTRRVSLKETTGVAPSPAPVLTASGAVAPVVPLGEALQQAAEAIPGTVVAGDQVDFTTFIIKDVEEFIPVLNDEHVAFAWAPISQPPEPLHPGVRIALGRFGMNELQVAQAIADKQLTSPQQFGNIWLFDIRITGTGVALRSEHKDDSGKVTQEAEYAIRDPAHYCTPDFLARCNGLPVILHHPKDKLMMDGDDFKERGIGTVFLPYIRHADQEVWAVAKIYDQAAAEMMQSIQLSTSPAVNWSQPNDKLKLEDGKNVLIESNPILLDHIAVCWQGVWDKGGDPSGVSITRGDEVNIMKINLKRIEGETEAAYQVRHDEAVKLIEGATKGEQRLDEGTLKVVEGLSAGLATVTKLVEDIAARQARMDEDKEKEEESKKDSARKDAKGRSDNFKFEGKQDGEDDDAFKKRLDADEEKLRCDMEEGGEDKEKAKADAKARRDAFEAEEGKKVESKKDASRKDELAGYVRKDEVEDLKARIAALTSTPSDADLNAFGHVQSRADEILSAVGKRARPRLPGESLLSYRRHFVNEVKPMTSFADLDLTVVAADEGLFTKLEGQVLTEALKVAKSPATVKAGELRMDEKDSGTGHKIREFSGSPSVWMDPISGPVRQAAKAFKLPKTMH